MGDVMDRRIERFQNKVQVNINLADDEIERLSHDLMILQGEVDSTKDELNRVSIQLQQREHATTGKINREQAKYSSKVSKTIIQNQNEINQINEQHKQKVAEIQKDYQKSLNKLRDICDKKEIQRTSQLDAELQQIEQQKRSLENTISNASSSIHEDDEAVISKVRSIEYSQVSRLQQSIISKNNERYQLLLSAKQRLTQVVQRLDDMEQDHRMTMNSLNLQLQNQDNKYKTRIKLLKDNSQREIAKLKNRYETLKKREENLQDSIDQVESNQKRQMLAAVQEGEELKRTLTLSYQMSSPEPSFNQENDTKEKLINDYHSLKKTLEEKENELVKKRTENESLKRELARLQFQAGLKKRQEKYGF